MALSRKDIARCVGNTETRKVILVLGMHRSGTSAVTRCLNLLGAEVGNKLLPPAEDNRSGFWEHADVVAIHEELLKDLDRVWHDARVLPEGWLLSAAARKARDKLAELISTDFDGSTLWAVKDPRLSRFVPLWREVLLESGLDAVALLVVRHPAEVARSLNIREGLRFETTYLNWLEHFVEAETATRGMPRSLVTYDGVLSDWRDAFAKVGRALSVKWPVPIEDAHHAVDAFLDRTKRHHVFSKDVGSMPEILERLYRFCRAFDPEAQGWKEISGLVDGYRLVAPPFLDRVENLLEERRAYENKALRVEKAMDSALDAIEKAAEAARSVPGPQISAADHAALYYRSSTQGFTEQRVCVREHRWARQGEKIFRFELAPEVDITSVRFDPSCEAGAFNIDWLKINDVIVANLPARVRSINQRVLDQHGGEGIWLTSNDGDPWVEFDLSDLLKGEDGSWTIEVKCRSRPVDGAPGGSTASMGGGLHQALATHIGKSVSRMEERPSAQADLLRRVDALEARDAQLEGELVASHERETRLQQRVDALQTHGALLEGELVASRERAAQVQRETFCVTARSLELETTLHELVEIKASTLWRVLVGMRSTLLFLPANVRLALRRVMRAAWWIMTPWRTPARLRFFREQHVAARHPSALSATSKSVSFEIVAKKAAGPGAGQQAPPAPAGYTYSPPKTDPAAVGKGLLTLSRHCLFSVIVPVYNTDSEWLRRAIASVGAQWYPHWELVLVDDHSTSPGVREVLDGLTDPRVTVVGLAENKGISGASNEGIARATGDFIVFLDHDDELTVDCLYELALRIDRDDPDYLYSDEDMLDADGNFREPFFKPDWSPDTMMSTMFTCHVSCVRRSLALELGGLRSEYDGSQDWDFVLRVSERARRIAHIAKVLYHWRITPNSCASGFQAKPYAIDAGKRAREDALRRRNRPGELVPVPELPGYFRTRYHMQGQPLISIIIPSKNQGVALKACIDSIFERSTYRHFEIVVINNGSTDGPTLDYLSGLRRREHVRVLDYDVPFNYSKINNVGLQLSRGQLLVFLNDDTEVLSGDWLEYMGGYAQLPHVGAVGAKLLYPGSLTVQHSGVLNLTNGPSHAFAKVDARAPGYFARNMLEHDWIAVTGACLMIERKKFDAVGGFDEDLAVDYNDVALCLSLGERGLYQVVCPGVELIHHESLSRGKDTLDRARMARLGRERTVMFGKHPGFYDRDPFHNPNLAPNDVHFGIRQ
ncbi:MAG TPA: glycosyltransferase [Rhodanobacteraceae bacterium]|nr:glycosyltransferase [Rhodanobacteraceae bacterium]